MRAKITFEIELNPYYYGSRAERLAKIKSELQKMLPLDNKTLTVEEISMETKEHE